MLVGGRVVYQVPEHMAFQVLGHMVYGAAVTHCQSQFRTLFRAAGD